MTPESNRRILLVDDNAAIHEDFKKILGAKRDTAKLADAKAAFFGASAPVDDGQVGFEFETANQGEEAIAKAKDARAAKRPFALAFVDVRMPPGLDGIETILRLWKEDPDVQAVVCTAFADYSWTDMIKKLGRTDRLLILKKPFDPIEVQQIALALTEKWNSLARERDRLAQAQRSEAEARAYAGSLATINRALETARSGAAAASRAKTEFLANMSHEIRTPMIAILGSVELLSGSSASELDEGIATIRSSSERLLSMIDDVLELASLEAGDRTTLVAEFSPRAVLEEVRGLHVESARAKGLALSTRIALDVPSVIHTDVTRLRKILGHLVSNAVKFTDQGSITMSVACKPGSDGSPGPTTFCVEDTGPGIDRDVRARLFEPFSMGDASSTRRHGGAGLGLALVRRWSQLLGAELEIESETGKGSKITLELPPENSGASPQGATQVHDARPKREGVRTAKIAGRVLIVEHVAATANLLALHLRNAGADVDCADDGRACVEMVERATNDGRRYDLVLVDVEAPVLDGFSATRELRARGAKIPIVAIGASSSNEVRERGMQAGCNAVWGKPIERQELVDGCRMWIEHGVAPALPSGAPSAIGSAMASTPVTSSATSSASAPSITSSSSSPSGASSTSSSSVSGSVPSAPSYVGAPSSAPNDGRKPSLDDFVKSLRSSTP